MNLNPAGVVTPGTRPPRADIMSCDVCGCDLIDEGLTLWCPDCQAAVSFASVIALGGCDD